MLLRPGSSCSSDGLSRYYRFNPPPPPPATLPPSPPPSTPPPPPTHTHSPLPGPGTPPAGVWTPPTKPCVRRPRYGTGQQVRDGVSGGQGTEGGDRGTGRERAERRCVEGGGGGGAEERVEVRSSFCVHPNDARTHACTNARAHTHTHTHARAHTNKKTNKQTTTTTKTRR